jgi:hypothetical protein
MLKSKLILSFFVGCISMMIAANSGNAQDTTWQQVLGGWVNDVYYENLFLGGSYYTRISLADIDGDRDLDMFYGGGDCGSLVYFENVGNSRQPRFELRNEEYPTFRHPTVYRGTANIDFADLDNDGDFDAAFDYDIDRGGFIFINTGNSYNPNFIRCYQCGNLGGAGNSTFTDIDGDGDFDYFSGHGLNGMQLHFAENTGTPDSVFITTITYHYQNLYLGTPFNFDMGDIDLDGDYDMIVCKRWGNVAYYENTGGSDSAYFSLITDNLLYQRDTTDLMETPELADMDNDGDLDLFLAGAYAHLYYFENTGYISEPQFIERYDTTYFYVIPRLAGAMLKNSVDIDNDGDDDLACGADLLLNESTSDEIRFRRIEWALPSIQGSYADMDGDSDFDCISPTYGPAPAYFRNIGGPFWPEWDQPEWLFPPDGRLYDVFSVTSGDLDNDGDIDVLIGDISETNQENFFYYRNDGTPGSHNFTYDHTMSLANWGLRYYHNPLLDDIDNDGDLDLMIGDTYFDYSHPTNLTLYRNDGTPESPVWTFETNDFQNIISEHRNVSTAPCLADIDNDGDKDLFVTSNATGLQLFLNPEIQTDVWNDNRQSENLPPTPITLQCYPNPFNSAVTISVENAPDENVAMQIYDILGRFQESLEMRDSQAVWDASGYSSGVYFVRLRSSQNTAIRKLLYLK